jgi:hypothetical protein
MLPMMASAADMGCNGNPNLTGACYAVRGEIVLSADIGYVTAREGSDRNFVNRAAPQSSRDAPEYVWNMFYRKPPSATVTGHFVVCPIPDQPSQFTHGEVSYLCIESASELEGHSGYIELGK